MPIAGSQQDSFTIMTWFRIHTDLFYEDKLNITTMELFNVGGAASCRVMKQKESSDELTLWCESNSSPGMAFSIAISDLPDPNAWIHLTLTSDGEGDAKLVVNSLNATLSKNSTEFTMALGSNIR